jgi:hypothetical protein
LECHGEAGVPPAPAEWQRRVFIRRCRPGPCRSRTRTV